MKSLLIIICGVILFIGCSNGKPVPYNEKELYRLVAANKAVALPVIGENTKGAVALERTIDFYNKVYEKAGYSFNASVIKLSQDMQEAPSIADSANVPFFITLHIGVIADRAEKYNLDLSDYMDRETSMAIKTIRQIMKEK